MSCKIPFKNIIPWGLIPSRGICPDCGTQSPSPYSDAPGSCLGTWPRTSFPGQALTVQAELPWPGMSTAALLTWRILRHFAANTSGRRRWEILVNPTSWVLDFQLCCSSLKYSFVFPVRDDPTSQFEKLYSSLYNWGAIWTYTFEVKSIEELPFIFLDTPQFPTSPPNALSFSINTTTT